MSLLKLNKTKKFSFLFFENKRNVNLGTLACPNNKIPCFTTDFFTNTGQTVVSLRLIKIKDILDRAVTVGTEIIAESTIILGIGSINAVISGTMKRWEFDTNAISGINFDAGYYYYEFSDSEKMIYSDVFYIYNSANIADYFFQDYNNNDYLT